MSHETPGIAIGAARADVVSTYPSAASNGTSLKIVGPEGNVIVFAFGEDDRVVSMHLSLPLDDQVLEDRARC